MKFRSVFLLVFILSVILGFVGCGLSPSALDTQASQTAVALAETRTQVYLDYQASKPTKMTTTTPLPPMITPTATQQLEWAEIGGTKIKIEDSRGDWSPAENKMVLIHRSPSESATISLISAPDFSINQIQVENAEIFNSSFLWSPDGKWLLFGGPHIHGRPWIVDEVRAVWMMDSTGNNLRQVLPDEYAGRFLEMIGWMDNNTIATSSYEGGGHFRVEIVNIDKGEVLASVGFHGPSFINNTDYVPAAVEYAGPYYLFLISRDQQSVELSTNFWGEKSPNVLPFPHETLPQGTSTFFKDWFPGQNRVLLQAFEYDYDLHDVTASKLLLWNLEDGVITTLVPGGIDGRFSPDGRYLAFTTRGPAYLDNNKRMRQDEETNLQSGSISYLQLLEMSSYQVFLGLPVIVTENSEYLFEIAETQMAFSPNSEYLAFLTPGAVVVDEKNWPMAVEIDGDMTYFSIVDLGDRELIYSAACSSSSSYASKMFVWSPQNDQIVFHDQDENWKVYDIDTDILSSITLTGGDQASWANWSYDGQYISFEVFNEDHFYDTVIVQIP